MRGRQPGIHTQGQAHRGQKADQNVKERKKEEKERKKE